MSDKWAKVFAIELELLFFAVLAVIAKIYIPPIPLQLFPFLLGIASFRVGRAISYNGIFEWLRLLCGIEATPDSSGAGLSNNLSESCSGVRRVLAELLCCPICSATWGVAALLLLHSFLPAFGRAAIYAFSAAGLAEIIHWISEHYEWSGRYLREESGSHWLAKNGHELQGWAMRSRSEVKLSGQGGEPLKRSAGLSVGDFVAILDNDPYPWASGKVGIVKGSQIGKETGRTIYTVLVTYKTGNLGRIIYLYQDDMEKVVTAPHSTVHEYGEG